MKKTTGIILFMLALFIGFMGSTPVQAAVIEGLTGVEDGGAYNTDKIIGITEEGKYTLKLADTSNNTQEITFWIDRTAPTVSGVVYGGSYNSDRPISVSDGTNGSGVALVLLDNQDITEAFINNSFTVSDEGTHILIVKDKAGNVTSITFTIQKKPAVTGLSFIRGPEWDDPVNELWGYTYTVEATGEVNGTIFTATGEDVVITNGAGEPIPNYFSRGEDYYSFNGVLDPDEGYYRAYVKDSNGNLSGNFILFFWRDWKFQGGEWRFRTVQDNATPSVEISSPSRYSALDGDSVSYTVTYNDDLAIGAITLSPSDVKVYNNGEEIARSVTVDGTGNTRTITVPVGSETGTLGIGIKEHSAYDVAGKFVPEARSADFRVNTTPFMYESVEIYSNNQISDPNSRKYAKVGNEITLEFITSEDVGTTPTVKIFGKSAIVTGSGSHWTAVYTTQSSDIEGAVPFEITCNAGANVYLTISATTDGSSVILDKTVPTCNIANGSAFNSKTVVFSDDLSGIYSSLIRKNAETANPIQNNTTITAAGTYELTLTDLAGNVKIVNFTIFEDKPTILDYTMHNKYGYWYDEETEQEGYTYELIATGTDGNGNPITADAAHTIVRTESGEDVLNSFDKILFNGPPHYPTGTFRVYIKDQAGNISDNFLTFTW